MITAEELAHMFHDVYEELAPQFDYNTRRESAVPWDEVPQQNKLLMICTCHVILKELGLA